MSSIDTQFLDFTSHHDIYEAIDPAYSLRGSATGKVIFISGASQGIGQATAIVFAKAGAKAIYLIARSEAMLKQTYEKVMLANPQTLCAYRVCDVTDPQQVQKSVEDCIERYGGIDVADANAGCLNEWQKIGESDVTRWWETWETNVRGAYHVARYCIPYLIESARTYTKSDRSGGHLIFTSSVGAQLLSPGASDYQTSKHAINRLCEFVHVDHGEDGIKTFAIHPGGVATSLAKHMPVEIHPYLTDQPELAAGFKLWLCSGKADWATGRYLSSNWDVSELLNLKQRILKDDLLVNRLRVENPETK